MEFRGETVSAFLLDRPLLLGMRFTIVDRRIRDRRVISERLHDVDLTALRPLSVMRLILRHHPDGRPQSLSFRDLGRNDDFSVSEIRLILSGDFSGSIVFFSIFFRLDRLQDQMPVTYKDVLFRRRIFLKLIVRPARLMRLVIPLALIHLLAVKLIVPQEIVSIKLRYRSFCLRGSLRGSFLLLIFLSTCGKGEKHGRCQDRADDSIALHSYPPHHLPHKVLC